MAAAASHSVVAVPWVCTCGRHLGTVAAGTLTEPNGDTSALPCKRRCPRCHRRRLLPKPPEPPGPNVPAPSPTVAP